MDQVTEIWADTGEVIQRDPTPDELAAWDADRELQAQAAAAAAAQAAADAATAQAAIAHAKSLGFTDDMIQVMYPALRPQP